MAHRTHTSKTRSSTFRAKIREELICAICLDFLSEPKVLSCAHSFCLACLKQTIQSKYKYGAGSELQKGDLECPSCRQVTKLPPGSVQELVTNYALKRLVALVSEPEKKTTRKLLSSRSQSLIQAINCPQHMRSIEFFCQDCNELLCPKCTSSTHRGHNFEDTDKVLPQQIQTLRSLIQPACEVATRAEGMIEQLYKEKDMISNNTQSTFEAIELYFKKIRKVIEQRESALKSTVQKYSDVKLNRLDSHNQKLQNHHDAILVKVAELERLIDSNDFSTLFLRRQAISEDLEAKEQSVMAVGELLQQSCDQGSLLFRESQSPSAFAETGILNERQQKPNSPFVTLRRLVVSEEEDPYLDVPLRFEDEQSQPPQKQVRVDETKSSIEYEPEGKPSKSSSLYDVPQPFPKSSHQQLSVNPQVPPRKSLRIIREPSPPQLPPRPRSRRVTPNTARPHNITGWDNEYQNYQPRSLQLDSPKAKAMTLPSSRFIRSSSTSSVNPILSDSSDSEGYDDLDDFCGPKPKPRTKPPPIPSNHPNRHPPRPKPKPKPRKISDANTGPISSKKLHVSKKRSVTLPDDIVYPPLPPKEAPTVVQPVKIIGNEMLSSKSMQETVYPNGICCLVELNGHFVVTDVYNHCLRVLDSNGAYLETIGKEGRTGGQFKEPSAIAIDSDNNLYVTERDNPRVQKFTSNGKYLTRFGQKTLLGSQLGDPMGIALTSDNSILISDWDKNEIIKISKLGKLEKIGEENNLLKFPAGLAINHLGNVLVTDRGNHCIWEVTIHGDVVQRIGSKGTRPGQFLFPYGIIVLSNKSIVVTESGNNRVSIFSENGSFIRCFGEKGSDPGQFDHPRHLCVDNCGHVVVVDQMNQRLQMFNVS